MHSYQSTRLLAWQPGREQHSIRGFYPLWRRVRAHLCVLLRWAYRLQITILRGDYHFGLFPLPSPVLRESWLVSFPPPNDMLKFSGWSYFISDAGKFECLSTCSLRRAAFAIDVVHIKKCDVCIEWTVASPAKSRVLSCLATGGYLPH